MMSCVGGAGFMAYLQEGVPELDMAWGVVLAHKAPRVPPHVAAHVKVEVPALLSRQAHLGPIKKFICAHPRALRTALKSLEWTPGATVSENEYKHGA